MFASCAPHAVSTGQKPYTALVSPEETRATCLSRALPNLYATKSPTSQGRVTGPPAQRSNIEPARLTHSHRCVANFDANACESSSSNTTHNESRYSPHVCKGSYQQNMKQHDHGAHRNTQEQILNRGHCAAKTYSRRSIVTLAQRVCQIRRRLLFPTRAESNCDSTVLTRGSRFDSPMPSKTHTWLVTVRISYVFSHCHMDLR